MRSVELAAVEAYSVLLGEDVGGLALPGPITYTEDVSAIIGFLRGRHEAHAEALVPMISDAGGDPVDAAQQRRHRGRRSPRRCRR